MTDNPESFNPEPFRPLAARMRPNSFDGFVGQQHLVAKGASLREAIDQGQLHSMLFWGPPGVGKTTLAKIIAASVNAHFESISAVLAGVKDIRAAVARAKDYRHIHKRPTLLFVDEVHRFNKAQQDAFLPFVEEGDVVLIGATTENPSFELNNALLSRCRVYVLKPLQDEDVEQLLHHALTDQSEGLGDKGLRLSPEAMQMLVQAADGDGRKALNLLEISSDLASDGQIDNTAVSQVLVTEQRRFDKQGEYFYDQISALHKSVRGSSPDAALYWYARMLDGGCDPLYIARRVVRMASEDIGNADPRALTLALNAWDVQQRLGSPEGELTLAQAVVYLACAPKSNAVYEAYNHVMADIKSMPSHDVPLHLRNAPTSLMKELDYGAEYRYAHSEPNAFAAGENYFPEVLKNQQYYYPVDRGLETKIADKLAHLREQNKKSSQQRYP